MLRSADSIATGQRMEFPPNAAFLAHVVQTPAGGWREHALADHLRDVGLLAQQHAPSFLCDWVKLAGKWHDLGKYRPAFQQRIRNVSGYDPEAHLETAQRVDHASAGALHALQQLGNINGMALAYAIAGHHAGLADWYPSDSHRGLAARLQEAEQAGWLAEALAQPVPEDILAASGVSASAIPGGLAGYALWVRMLFSCLVDADFLDTEAFMQGRKRGGYRDVGALLSPFNAWLLQRFAGAEDTPVNQARADVLAQCRQAAALAPGHFSLTVPTGGGKTLSSLAFALEHAVRWHKRRVIYVIPYTSIIEQTADTFRGIFGDEVVEHHSSLDPSRETAQNRLAAENWDATLIVTTSVQFYESLFAASPSRCRKLHNIVDSVVVLDEAQLLPPEWREPICAHLDLLVQHYGTSVVLCTATQPALAPEYDKFKRLRQRGLTGIREIIHQPDELFRRLDRVEYHWPPQPFADWSELAQQLQQESSVLAIVNTRKACRDLYHAMPPGTWHLSALMCPQHRTERIAEIKARLRAQEPVRLVSTSLIEAGVDISFPVVYRAYAGLDSMAQAAGRCNREGELPQKGRVVVFQAPTPIPPGLQRQAAEAAGNVLRGHTGHHLPPSLFQTYFRQFYDRVDTDKARDIARYLTPDAACAVAFRSAAELFKVIDDGGQQPVFVEYDQRARDALRQLRHAGPNRERLRSLQRYVVNLPPHQFKALQDAGELNELHPGYFTLVREELYDEKVGLVLPDAAAPAYAAERLMVD